MNTRLILLIAVLGTAPLEVLAQQAPAPQAPATQTLAYGAPISLQAARSLIDRVLAEAREGGFRMAAAVVEPSGELVAFARMDDTQYGAIVVAQRKARTAARSRLATAVMEERVLAGRSVILANDDVLPIGGGIPIVVDGRIIGALGVSGGTAAEDAAIAQTALLGL